MGAPYSEMEVASFMSCSKGYMGECGMRWACFDVQKGYSNWSFLVFISCVFFIRGGYAEVVNMDDDVMALLQKSISAKLCPTVLGQSCMDIVANPPKPGEPSYDSWLQEKEVRQTKISRQKKLQEPKISTRETLPALLDAPTWWQRH